MDKPTVVNGIYAREGYVMNGLIGYKHKRAGWLYQLFYHNREGLVLCYKLAVLGNKMAL